MKGYLYLWAGLGFFLLLILPKPKTRTEAIVEVFFCGPLIWIMFIPISIKQILKNRKQQQ